MCVVYVSFVHQFPVDNLQDRYQRNINKYNYSLTTEYKDSKSNFVPNLNNDAIKIMITFFFL